MFVVISIAHNFKGNLTIDSVQNTGRPVVTDLCVSSGMSNDSNADKTPRLMCYRQTAARVGSAMRIR